ncbi:MAG: hypothetical protein AAFV95_14845 [Bacteroidota bacterium]
MKSTKFTQLVAQLKKQPEADRLKELLGYSQSNGMSRIYCSSTSLGRRDSPEAKEGKGDSRS